MKEGEFIMDLSGILADKENKGLYVIAKVKSRIGQTGRATDYEKILVCGSYELATKLSEKYKGMDIIIIPPIGEEEIAPRIIAHFFRRYYGIG